MSDTSANEIWQVDVNGTIYEAPFYELGEWIEGGSLLRGDKVRKGNLRWIEAQRVPSLVPFFNAKDQGAPMPVVVTTTEAAPPPPVQAPLETHVEAPAENAVAAAPVAARPAEPGDTSQCLNHPDLASGFLCSGCGIGLCRGCVKSFGGSVRLCSVCGSMCHSLDEVAKTQREQTASYAAAGEGFGFADFGAALSYPFRFKTSLFFGALLFMFFSLGQSAASIGGIFMTVAALFCVMLANMLTFGVLSNTVNNFVQGKLGENFMPDFDDFSIWDDVLHPFILSIAAYLVSFGPFLATAAVGFYMVFSSVSTQMDTYRQDLEKIPGTQVYAGRKLAEQSGDVKNVLQEVDQKQAERIAALAANAENGVPNADAAPSPVVDEETREQERLWAMATESRRQQLESVVGKSPETREREQAAMMSALLNLAAPLVVIGAITLFWGIFFFPAVCAVAGYTRSFFATINPLVGLDTIWRLGFNYVKILFMGFLLLVMSAVVGGFLGMIFGAFDLPGMGNLVAKAFGSMFTFYVSVVFSCIIGFALYKSADKLKLTR